MGIGADSRFARFGRTKLVPAGAVLVLFLLLLCSLGSVAVADDNDDDDDDYELLVLHVEIVPGASIETINLRYGTATIDSLHPLYLLEIPEEGDEEEFASLLEADPEIVEAEFAWEGETPEASRQMVVTAIGGTIEEFLDQGIADRLRLADAHRHTQGDGVLVAVIDTGVLAEHPAFSGAIAPGGYDFVDSDPDPTDEANGIDDDGDGLVDEGAGHGTMVAGIVRLVAPHARILPLRVLDDEGSGRTFDVAKAIRHAIEQGADIINLSLGLWNHSMVIRHEIKLADSLGVVMVSAAGNDGIENPRRFPASAPQVLGVGGVDSSDVKAGFSNWSRSLDVSAPGVGILAPYHDGGYAIGAGTSFATALVTGQCALILSTHPGLSPGEVREAARLGVVDIYDIPGNEEYLGRLGEGRIDAYETWLHAPKAAHVEAAGRAAGSGTWVVFPNPAVSGRPVCFRVVDGPEGQPARGWIVDVRGRRIAGLQPPPGRVGLFFWDGKDKMGRPAGAGVYFLRIDGGDRPGIASSPLLLLDR